MIEVKWGGRIRGITNDASRSFEGVVLGSFAGSVPETLETWVASKLLLELNALFSTSDSPASMAQDLVSLAHALTASSRAALREGGAEGVVTIARATIAEELLVDAAPAPPLRRRPIDETALATPALHIPALPFEKGKAVPPPSAAEEAHDELGATAFMPPIDIPDDPLPFSELTVEQYASLCAERARSPGSEAAILTRYRVANSEALDRRWRDKLDADPELNRRWKAAYAQYDAWLSSQK